MLNLVDQILRLIFGQPACIETTNGKVYTTVTCYVGGVRCVKVKDIITDWHRANDDGTVNHYCVKQWWPEGEAPKL